MKKRRWTVLVGALLALASVAVWRAPQLVERLAYAQETGRAQAAQEGIQQARNLSDAFKAVARSVRPSVVSVSVVQRVTARQPGMQDPFEDFFGPGFPSPFGRRSQPRERQFERRGMGTGVIVSKDGLVLTNNHVVAEADEITVRLVTGKEYKGTLVGADAKTDVAVVRIEAEDLTPAELGDSDAMEVGEWVLAVGSPFGLDQTVTAGIVSAKGRANVGVAEYEDFLQTDAAINPGNSGGPLLNLDGKVIGINTAIASRSGGNMGIGFAIPANMAKSIMTALVEKGQVERGWLGVVIQDLNEDLSDSFNYDGTEGVLVGDVMDEGPAAQAELKPGDIIVRFDGEPVKNVNELRNRVAATKPGSQVPVQVYREGKMQEIKVTVARMEDAEPVAEAPMPDTVEKLGMAVGPVTDEVAENLGMRQATGVLVREVEPGGTAARAGISVNDVIVGVNNKAVRNMKDFQAAMKDADVQRGIRLHVYSRGRTHYVFIRSR